MHICDLGRVVQLFLIELLRLFEVFPCCEAKINSAKQNNLEEKLIEAPLLIGMNQSINQEVGWVYGKCFVYVGVSGSLPPSQHTLERRDTIAESSSLLGGDKRAASASPGVRTGVVLPPDERGQ